MIVNAQAGRLPLADASVGAAPRPPSHTHAFVYSGTIACNGTHRRWLVYACECGTEHRILALDFGPLFALEVVR
jgi:hypothetical protein